MAFGENRTCQKRVVIEEIVVGRGEGEIFFYKGSLRATQKKVCTYYLALSFRIHHPERKREVGSSQTHILYFFVFVLPVWCLPSSCTIYF